MAEMTNFPQPDMSPVFFVDSLEFLRHKVLDVDSASVAQPPRSRQLPDRPARVRCARIADCTRRNRSHPCHCDCLSLWYLPVTELNYHALVLSLPKTARQHRSLLDASRPRSSSSDLCS